MKKYILLVLVMLMSIGFVSAISITELYPTDTVASGFPADRLDGYLLYTQGNSLVFDNITKNPLETATFGYLLNGSGDVVSVIPFVGDVATFGVSLDSNASYYILVGTNGSVWDFTYAIGDSTRNNSLFSSNVNYCYTSIVGGMPTLPSCSISGEYHGIDSVSMSGDAICTESWVQDSPSSCDGLISSYTISYTDQNICNTTTNLPVDNGTIVSCCVNSWVQDSPSSCDGLISGYNITYTDGNVCNNTLQLPANNGTLVPCCIESWMNISSSCNGIISNYSILYTDSNTCNTVFQLPVDNGTIVPCCVENWVNHSTCIANFMTITYLDSHSCNTVFTLPVDNGSIVSCSPIVGGQYRGGASQEVVVPQSALPTTTTTTTVTQHGALYNVWQSVTNFFKFTWLTKWWYG